MKMLQLSLSCVLKVLVITNSKLSKYILIICSLTLQDVDYEATMATKLSIAKKIFSLEKDLTLKSSSFQKFFLENEVYTY